jgi:hypothetical protein
MEVAAIMVTGLVGWVEAGVPEPVATVVGGDD